MSVLIVTSVGDIVVDLHTDRCPLTSKNFLKLCKIKYYNGCLFHKIEKDFIAQTGDPTGLGSGGDSIYKFLYGDQARFFGDEIHPDLKHSKKGTVAMASAGENLNASQFYFTLRDDLDYLDGKHTVFGTVEEQEGLDTLTKINEAFTDDNGRPLKDIRIKHTYILDDPFDDPPQLTELIPERSPEGKPTEERAEERLEDSWIPLDEKLDPAQLEEVIRSKEAHTNAAILESIGDIPDADIKPPDNVLFVCKLNPVTQDEDLFTIFSRFGTVIAADIIRDYKTGDSLCYAFIEFEDREACERAYFKMDNALIDDRRIHVDFSQSVAKQWAQYRHGKRTNADNGDAKDADEGINGKQKGTKYVLKDDTTQRGGHHNQRYEMVFEKDALEESDGQERSKERRVEEPQRSDKAKHRSYDKRDGDRLRGYEDERKVSRDYQESVHRSSASRSDDRQERRDYERRDDRARGRDDRDAKKYRKSGSHGHDRHDKRDDKGEKDDIRREYRSSGRHGHDRHCDSRK